MLNTVCKVLCRKKVINPVSAHETRLARVLNTFDLTALGVGSTLGVGVYVLVGNVARNTAGPSVVLSFLIAAIASVFAGLCYAEFGARTPRAGSAYIYSYVSVGEFVAFVIGWNLILEYIVGSASVARGLSTYLDNLINGTLEDTFKHYAPLPHTSFMSEYFDFLAFGASFLLAVALAFGMKESSLANNIFTGLNLAVVLFVVIAGMIKADPHNWSIDPSNVTNTTADVGSGYFFPFGIEGMIAGAATCFYGFVGFDCIATTGEEVKNPQKAIPIAIISSLCIIFLSYFGTSTVVTMMVPYYQQDVNAPIPYAFHVAGWEWAKWIVGIGGIFGLLASLFGAMFPLPRVIYAMASDGIIFKFLGEVSARFQTPVVGTLLAGLLTGLMGALFELKQLVRMMSIGTLLAYTIVAASVLLLRYTETQASEEQSEDELATDERGLLSSQNAGAQVFLKQIFNCNGFRIPNRISQRLVSVEIFVYCVVCILIGLGIMHVKDDDGTIRVPVLAVTVIFALIAVIILISLYRQPTSRRTLTFQVPFVPLIPALSIFVNIYLMLMLDGLTWIRFAVWMVIGFCIYGFYGLPNSIKDFTYERFD